MPRKVSQLNTSRNKRQSSANWLKRQQQDPFSQRARSQGFRARSVFKLQEIDRRFRLLQSGAHVLDLGAAPGSWSQYASTQGCMVVAVDLEPVALIDSNVRLLQGDFLDPGTQRMILDLMQDRIDLIMSDMAASSTGQRSVDRLRAEALGEAVLDFAGRYLRHRGDLLVKLLRGAEAPIMAKAKIIFSTTRLIKPAATHKGSSEIYLLARAHRNDPHQARTDLCAGEKTQ